MTVPLALGLAVILEAAVAFAAYQRGKRHGRVTLPVELVRELREHKLRCIGEQQDRVDLEIALLCEAEPSRVRSGSTSSRAVSC